MNEADCGSARYYLPVTGLPMPLFQRYLYNDLGEVERAIITRRDSNHSRGAIRGASGRDVTVQLAMHYAEAGEAEKAVKYLLKAGDKAREQYAHQEAIDHYLRALTFLEEPGKADLAARTMMKLGLTYHHALEFQKASQAYEKGFNIWQQAISMAPSAPIPPSLHALRILEGMPATLDPALSMASDALLLIDNLFSGLAQYSGEENVVPDVARDWEIMDEGAKYVIHLRDNVLWSDGNPLKAADFEFAWKRILNPETESPVAGLLYDIKGADAYHKGHLSNSEEVGVNALDDTTLAVTLEGPTAYFPHILAQPNLAPVPRQVVKRLGEAWCEPNNIVTNGPFRFESEPTEAQRTLVRNPSYHGLFSGNVEIVELCRPDENRRVALSLYQNNELDFFHLWRLPPEKWNRRDNPSPTTI